MWRLTHEVTTPDAMQRGGTDGVDAKQTEWWEGES